MEPADPLAAARALLPPVARVHRIDLPRSWRRRATPARSARPGELTIATCPGGVWLDVHGRAGIFFTAEQWAQLAVEALLLLCDLTEVQP